jgi:hypothetical protein
MQVLIGSLKVTGGICIAGLIIMTALKDGSDDFKPFVLNRTYMLFSAAFGFLLLAVFNAFFGSSLHRLHVVLRLRRVWSSRRRRALCFAYFRAATMEVILVVYFCSTCARAAKPSWYCTPSPFIAICDFVQWSGWNSMLLLVLIDGHGIVLTEEQGGRPDGQVRDRPLSWHWPKLVLWIVGEGVQPNDTCVLARSKGHAPCVPLAAKLVRPCSHDTPTCRR